MAAAFAAVDRSGTPAHRGGGNGSNRLSETFPKKKKRERVCASPLRRRRARGRGPSPSLAASCCSSGMAAIRRPRSLARQYDSRNTGTASPRLRGSPALLPPGRRPARGLRGRHWLCRASRRSSVGWRPEAGQSQHRSTTSSTGTGSPRLRRSPASLLPASRACASPVAVWWRRQDTPGVRSSAR
jgi:hypothetical protein